MATCLDNTSEAALDHSWTASHVRLRFPEKEARERSHRIHRDNSHHGSASWLAGVLGKHAGPTKLRRQRSEFGTPMLLEAAGQGRREAPELGVGCDSRGWALLGHMVQPGYRESLTPGHPVEYKKVLP